VQFPVGASEKSAILAKGAGKLKQNVKIISAFSMLCTMRAPCALPRAGALGNNPGRQ